MWLLLCLRLLPGPAAGALPQTVDLAAQFPGAAVRDQGSTGGCHVFSTIALLEAALHRRWGLSLALSEADLFVSKVIKDKGYYNRVITGVRRGESTEFVYSFVEGGDPGDDIEFALKHGIAKARTAPWPAFAKRYDGFRKAQRAAIDDLQDKFIPLNAAAKDVKEDLNRVGEQEAAGLTDYFGAVQRHSLQQVSFKIDGARLMAKDRFLDFLEQAVGKNEAEAEALLLGKDPQLAKDRLSSKILMSGFRVTKTDFTEPPIPWGTTPEQRCAQQIPARKAVLMLALSHKIPVVVSLELAGLAAWGQAAEKTAKHAFTVTGYVTDAAGSVTLKSRNSWGGDNPDLPEKDFCRVYRVTAALTNQE